MIPEILGFITCVVGYSILSCLGLAIAYAVRVGIEEQS